jgi:hypothetical protein
VGISITLTQVVLIGCFNVPDNISIDTQIVIVARIVVISALVYRENSKITKDNAQLLCTAYLQRVASIYNYLSSFGTERNGATAGLGYLEVSVDCP